MIVRPLCRAIFGDMRLTAYKYSQESGIGPMGVLGSAVPLFAMPLHNPVQGLEAVCWWETGRLCGLPVEGGLGETLPRQEEHQASRPVHTVRAGLNSHQSPLLTFLLLASMGQQTGRLRDSHQEG